MIERAGRLSSSRAGPWALRGLQGPRGIGAALASAAALVLAQAAGAQGFAVGQDLAPPVRPLNQVTVPDVNVLGLLDAQGNPGTVGAAAWPKITKPNQRVALQQLGKALFWDMQVGGDGIQSCATCHYHAGADNRKRNQMSPGLKAGDTAHDLAGGGPNATLTAARFSVQTAPNRGLPANENALVGTGWQPDTAQGAPGAMGGKANAALDVNDVVSSQGPRRGEYNGLSGGRQDRAVLDATDALGFSFNFTNNSAGIPDTVRRVEPRNSPTTLNSVFNFRNFWDGRADAFFNGVNPLGFRDPGARVKTYVGGTLGAERLAIPFSSLASQAVGPIESTMEMVFHVGATDGTGRPHRDLGKKLRNAQPLAGQVVAANDSLLAGLLHGSGRGLNGTYGALVQQVFDQRFWGNGLGGQVCLDASGALLATQDGVCAGAPYTLLEWNFSMFFGLAVQAYEAMLTTPNTMVDLVVGGIATGTVTNGTGRQQRVVNVAGLTLDQCIAAVALNNRAAAVDVATDLCTKHYAQFIHRGAVTGKESATAPFGLNGLAVPAGAAIPADTAIGGCATPVNTTATSSACGNASNNGRRAAAQGALLNVNRGLGRFFAGATACSVCHFNPEFTGATVAAATGFGAAPPIPAPPGQFRPEPGVLLERMPTFNGAPAVYDIGFYNIGVRPTPEDLSLGELIGGVPASLAKIAELINGGAAEATDLGLDGGRIAQIASDLASGTVLRLPTSPTDLTPRPFVLNLACGAGLVGGGNANNNPNPRCVPTVIPGERLLRNGAFKASGLRNVKFTGPYFHTGTKMDLRQVLEFYKTAGRVGVLGGPGENFANLNFNNLDAGLRVFNLGAADESAVVELMETGLTDWRVAYEEGPFDHPEICVPHGHNDTNGKTILAGIPAVGLGGAAYRLQTFEEQLRNVTSGRSHTLADSCSVPGMSTGGLSNIDVPPP